MGRIYRFNLLRLIREKENIFWTLLFPLILGTLFYVSFGHGSQASGVMNAIPAALVQEGNEVFESFLQELEGESISLQILEEEAALSALREGKVEGIFYSAKEPALTVAGVQTNESILGAFLEAYLQNQHMIEDIARENPLQLFSVMQELSDFRDLIQPVAVNEAAMDDSLSYFFALIGMTCLFGAFSGMSAACCLRADQSALALRRSIVPVHRLKLVIGELLAVFTIQFINCCLLLAYLHFVLKIPFGEKWPLLLPVCILGSMCGVSIGILIGCLPLREGPKTGILVGSSLAASFLAGLMVGNMKDIIEHHCPFLNRINPASLISDAFYSISIYENPARYRMNLALLAAITVLVVLLSYRQLRRERYVSL